VNNHISVIWGYPVIGGAAQASRGRRFLGHVLYYNPVVLLRNSVVIKGQYHLSSGTRSEKATCERLGIGTCREMPLPTST
jgi:hypothetical protein